MLDKSWTQQSNRFRENEFRKGLKQFMEMAKKKADSLHRIRCPCAFCCNRVYLTMDIVEDHIWEKGFDKKYKKWIFHGEKVSVDCTLLCENLNDEYDDNEADDNNEEDNGDRFEDMLNDVLMGDFMPNENVDAPLDDDMQNNSELDPCQFQKLWDDAHLPIYPGCTTYSKLSFVVRLLHYKIRYNWSNKSVNKWLQFLKKLLPAGNNLPNTVYEAKSLIRGLGFNYSKIEACKNDCVLFWKDNSHLEICPKCNEPRWSTNTVKSSKIPHKVVTYFPLKPRLKRLFMFKSTAFDMRWHYDRQRLDDRVLEHPSDSEAWKSFDQEHQWFSNDSRNVRLGLVTDGFNPFSNMNVSHSTWPVFLVPYNLPPWKYMKDSYFMMSLIIPGPKAPGNDIDVYLEPLIDDLKDMWENGVITYDASKSETFKLHAALMWTINDFPAYGNLSGWSTKGRLACPCCNENTDSKWLQTGKKFCYMGHRRFLPSCDKMRLQKACFDGTKEFRDAPSIPDGGKVLHQLSKLRDIQFGKLSATRKRRRTEDELNWTKKSIFFSLPYWSSNKLRHCLDVMHIEKNICDNLLGTLMGVVGKTKDTPESREDLRIMGIRHDLQLQSHPNGGSSMPPACFTFSKAEKKNFCNWLKSVKFPDGFASNISRCVDITECKITGLKSHDCHILIQRLIPVGIRGSLTKKVTTTIIELCTFFRALCSRTVKVDVVERLKKDIVKILCKLETIFPPSFFTVMVHLAVHLPREVLLGGPVQGRWMYWGERYMGVLKRMVKNRARIEGSIAEAYINLECLSFCSQYLEEVESNFEGDNRNGVRSNYIGSQGLSVFSEPVRPLGKATTKRLEDQFFTKATWYILNNCKEVSPYLCEHLHKMRLESMVNVDSRHESEFPKWFKLRVKESRGNGGDESDQLYALACGPDQRVESYAGCIINGTRFHTKMCDRFRRTQNSGVSTDGEHNGKPIDFFGVVVDILKIRYMGDQNVFLLRCDWWNLEVKGRNKGVIYEEHCTSVNMSRTWYNDDPFILSSQATQVFYLKDTKYPPTSKWYVVQNVTQRGYFSPISASEHTIQHDQDEELGNNNEIIQEDECLGGLPHVEQNVDEEDIVHRDDIPSEHLEGFSMFDLEHFNNNVAEVELEVDNYSEEEDHASCDDYDSATDDDSD